MNDFCISFSWGMTNPSFGYANLSLQRYYKYFSHASRPTTAVGIPNENWGIVHNPVIFFRLARLKRDRRQKMALPMFQHPVSHANTFTTINSRGDPSRMSIFVFCLPVNDALPVVECLELHEWRHNSQWATSAGRNKNT